MKTLKGESIKGYIKPTIQLNPKFKYVWYNVKGNCLDSSDSPIRIKDGDAVLMHAIPTTENSIMFSVREIVCIKLYTGQMFIKHYVFGNFVSNQLIVRMYNPFKEFYVPINQIDEMFIVDEVQSNPKILN